MQTATITQKTSQAQRVKTAMQIAKERIIKQLQWSEMDYAQYQYEQGILFLQKYIPNDPWGIEMLERNRIYWNWWKNQWHSRDVAFLECEIQAGSLKQLEAVYMSLHNAAALVDDIFPSRIVIDSSYSQMIEELHKSEMI